MTDDEARTLAANICMDIGKSLQPILDKYLNLDECNDTATCFLIGLSVATGNTLGEFGRAMQDGTQFDSLINHHVAIVGKAARAQLGATQEGVH